MPTFCADTPTQAWPCDARWRWKNPQSGAASMPAETLCHSTTTVPLNRSGSDGRRTTIRVRKCASSLGRTVHRPSAPRSPSSSYEIAVPSTPYSVSEYLSTARS